MGYYNVTYNAWHYHVCNGFGIVACWGIYAAKPKEPGCDLADYRFQVDYIAWVDICPDFLAYCAVGANAVYMGSLTAWMVCKAIYAAYPGLGE